ncbi:MAG TPA: hypothetical protein VJH96_03290 [Patescibacteria group bacterium]|nr:hypothetical protein [Patescibacteria group bacterium]
MKKAIVFVLLLLLVYTRFIGLDWGLPYPMHPDERNMANAIQQLTCRNLSVANYQLSIKDCFNPHFFAYGQFPLYLGYGLIQLYHLIAGKTGFPINFFEAIMSLRIISAAASIITVFVLMHIIKSVTNKQSSITNKFSILVFLFFIFQPYFIQFSHFGTTESLLMLFYSLIIYQSLQLIDQSRSNRDQLKSKTVFLLSLFSGLVVATKVSSLLFVFAPLVSIGVHYTQARQSTSFLHGVLYVTRQVIFFLLLMVLFSIIFSPHNLISFRDFVGSMQYESSVATGSLKVFYTRQFEGIMPVWFQVTRIFPYVLGWPQYVVALCGFFLLPWRKKEVNLLRFAFLIYFIPSALLYAKWTRFMAPIFPIMSVFSILFLLRIHTYMYQFSIFKHKFLNNLKFLILNFTLCVLIFAFIAPGIAYLTIYRTPDVRFTASKWIYQHIPENAYILFETANVVDIPFATSNQQLTTNNYQLIGFNFYDLDENPLLQGQLDNHIKRADYIFIPSRRIFKNHPAEKYPLLTNYYNNLFSGVSGFQKVAEFTSHPRIELFGKTLLEFPDESSEETWTVFDHPVIRIYQRI